MAATWTVQMSYTYSVKTRYGEVVGVPKTSWKELEPFHASITRATFEVLSEGCFHPGSYKQTNKRGFFAPSQYWQRFARDPERFPLLEPFRFPKALLKNDSFLEPIRAFNSAASTDWLSSPDWVRLGRFVYSLCFYLTPVLHIDQRTGCVRPAFAVPGL